jgi:hypothetical protein
MDILFENIRRTPIEINTVPKTILRITQAINWNIPTPINGGKKITNTKKM